MTSSFRVYPPQSRRCSECLNQCCSHFSWWWPQSSSQDRESSFPFWSLWSLIWGPVATHWRLSTCWCRTLSHRHRIEALATAPPPLLDVLRPSFDWLTQGLKPTASSRLQAPERGHLPLRAAQEPSTHDQSSPSWQSLARGFLTPAGLTPWATSSPLSSFLLVVSELCTLRIRWEVSCASLAKALDARCALGYSHCFYRWPRFKGGLFPSTSLEPAAHRCLLQCRPPTTWSETKISWLAASSQGQSCSSWKATCMDSHTTRSDCFTFLACSWVQTERSSMSVDRLFPRWV